MKNDNSNSDKAKGGKKKIIKLAVLGMVLVTIFLAFFLPYTVSNGVEKFSGKEAEIAKDVIGDGSYDGPSADPFQNLRNAFAFRGKVTLVEKQNPERECYLGSSTTKGVAYNFEIDRVTFFGIQTPGWVSYMCAPK